MVTPTQSPRAPGTRVRNRNAHLISSSAYFYSFSLAIIKFCIKKPVVGMKKGEPWGRSHDCTAKIGLSLSHGLEESPMNKHSGVNLPPPYLFGLRDGK